MVPQSRQNRNYVISDSLAFQEALAIQLANADQAVLEQHAGTAESILHSQLRFAHVQNDLTRESSQQPEDAQAVFGHAQRHGGVVAALQFHVD